MCCTLLLDEAAGYGIETGLIGSDIKLDVGVTAGSSFGARPLIDLIRLRVF